MPLGGTGDRIPSAAPVRLHAAHDALRAHLRRRGGGDDMDDGDWRDPRWTPLWVERPYEE